MTNSTIECGKYAASTLKFISTIVGIYMLLYSHFFGHSSKSFAHHILYWLYLIDLIYSSLRSLKAYDGQHLNDKSHTQLIVENVAR